MNPKLLLKDIISVALPLYGERESTSIAYILMDHFFGLTKLDILTGNSSIDITEEFRAALEDIRRGRPVQYITGKTFFCGMEIMVREGVLIPRPETEELVHCVLENIDPQSKILDIGTGSGAIAVTLAKKLPHARVSAVDISESALTVARVNAQRADVRVGFIKQDILEWNKSDGFSSEMYDVIVSNPPYIPAGERYQMHKNVKEFEPTEALFVDESDPLIFYKSISSYALQALNNNGWLFFEIHESYGVENLNMLVNSGFRETEIIKDIHGKDRIIKCRKSQI